jgi:ectoine hydroxylase-related dioxygenase (phytanoyl-CoA dioxygenase family)
MASRPARNTKQALADPSAEDPSIRLADLSHEALRGLLNTHGYCVVKGAVPQLPGPDVPNGVSTVADFVNDMWEYMESGGTGMRRDRPATMLPEKMPFNRHGLLQHFGCGHTRMMWRARLHPGVLRIFETLWQTPRLLTSFDGFAFSLKKFAESNAWHHIDQGHTRRGFQCVQGSLNLQPCGPHDGGLVVYVGSHLLHDQFFDETGVVARGDWHKMTADEMLRYYHQCPRRKVCVLVFQVGSFSQVCLAPGDFVLWDSRTVHEAEFPHRYVRPDEIRRD